MLHNCELFIGQSYNYVTKSLVHVYMTCNYIQDALPLPLEALLDRAM